PDDDFCNIPILISSLISFTAVSEEHFVIVAHFEEVRLPSNPSNNLLSMRLCLSFISVALCLPQNCAFFNMRVTASSVFSRAPCRQFKNHSIQFVISRFPFWVLSNML